MRGERGGEGERVIEGGETVLSQQYPYLLHTYIQMYTHTSTQMHTHSTRQSVVQVDGQCAFIRSKHLYHILHVVKGG